MSLQIKAISSGPNLRASRTIAAVVNPTSPTSFNTLSNVYATAIDRSTPVTAINTKQPLKLQTQNLAHTPHGAPTPYGSGPETPLTAQPMSPAVANRQDMCFPSTMTATPPMSAGPFDGGETKSFSFNAADTAATPTAQTADGPSDPHVPAPASQTANTEAIPHHRNVQPLTVSRPVLSLPYVRNRSLHSILRNSPLPPPTARTPISPRRQSQRLADKAARRVCYQSPIEDIITTNDYVASHIDLLLAGDSPLSAHSPIMEHSPVDETTTCDGGLTPGPFEEMRRRMAGLAARTPTSPVASGNGASPTGVRKRRRKERGRRWMWTIGTEEEGEAEEEVGGAIAALRAASRAQAGSSPAAITASSELRSVTVEDVVQSPMDIATPSIESFQEADAAMADVTMSESEVQGSSLAEVDARRAISLSPGEVDVDHADGAEDPDSLVSRLARDESEGMFNPETGTRRDTPVPADMVAAE